MNRNNILLIGAAGVLLIGVIVLVLVSYSGGGGDSADVPAVPVTLWGPFPSRAVSSVITTLNRTGGGFAITYVGRNPATYERDVTEALAEGTGPDLWFVTQKNVTRNRDKITQIPFASMSERYISDTFADAGAIFTDNTASGSWAVPVLIDPLVLYWNKLLFSSAGIATPPATWNDYLTDAQAMTKKTGSTLTVAGAALGEHSNVTHAMDILAMLILQLGNPIIDQTGSVTLNSGQNSLGARAANAVDFYTEFADPARPAYSWNRSLTESRSHFVNALLGMYIGYGSEYDAIARGNPHLEFDIARVPQVKGGDRDLTNALVYGVAVSRVSPNKTAAGSAAFALAGSEADQSLATALGMAPARRDLLGAESDNPVLSVVNRSAVSARSWLEPDPDKVDTIFRDLIESVATGRAASQAAIQSATNQLRALQ